jgi:hypothetical protein
MFSCLAVCLAGLLDKGDGSSEGEVMTIVRKSNLLGILGLLLVWTGMAQANETVISSAQDRQSVDLTVYNQDLALVREVREVLLPRGEFPFEFRDVPSRINPVTLLISSGGRAGLEIHEQNYEFDLLSRDRILNKYVGREVAWIQEDGSRITGKLLGMNSGPVYEVGGEIQFEVPGRLALPDLPANLRARPTLVWLAAAAHEGRTAVETSYLTQGISWHADYVLQLDEKGEHAGLQAWVSVDNRCGATFDDAKLLLVAGDINQARPDRGVMMDFAAAPMAEKSRPFQEESLYDYHLYTLQRPTTLKDNQIKQISLFEAEGISVQKQYRLTGQPRFFRSIGHLQDKSKIDVSYRLDNSEANQLGMPLPAGVFRVYGRSASGARQLLGEDRIDHTPRDEEIELKVGQAFDIVAERVRSDSRRLADNLYRHTFRITLRNHKDEDIVVEVVEAVGGYWEIVNESQAHRKVDASTVAFDVPVKADGETVLTYTVEVKY